MNQSSPHTPVLLNQTIEGLNIRPDGIYIDATYGAGGHSREIFKRLGKKGRLIAFDQDRTAQQYAIEADNFILIHSNFVFIPNFLKFLGIDSVDGIMADLGVSSMHLDMPERGFSYRFDAPLDMRMNTQQRFSAKDVVNKYPEKELIKIFKEYGEVHNARQVAKAIVQSREKQPINTTKELVEIVENFYPPKYRNKNLSKIFQALRIEVNGEIDKLKKFLEIGGKVIRPGGRFAIITFHSLEDRIVKNYFKTGTFDGVPQKDIYGNASFPFKPVNKKVIVPDWQEQKNNPRSRSAKLRIAEKL